MRRKPYVLACLILSVFWAGCGQKMDKMGKGGSNPLASVTMEAKGAVEENKVVASSPKPAAPAGEPAANDSVKVTLASVLETQPDRYLIRNATLTLETQDVQGAASALRDQLRELKGYVADAHEATDGLGGHSVTIQVRVPYTQFDTLMGRLEKLGKTLDRQVTAEDVTEEFVDTQSKVRNLKRTELRLLEHLSRTGKLSDTLLVEKELNRVREEVEQREGRLRFLTNRVAFSTATVTFKEAARAQPITPAESYSSAQVASQATRSLVEFAQTLWTYVIWLGIWAIVWLPVTVAAIYLFRRNRPSRPAVPPLPPQS